MIVVGVFRVIEVGLEIVDTVILPRLSVPVTVTSPLTVIGAEPQGLITDTVKGPPQVFTPLAVKEPPTVTLVPDKGVIVLVISPVVAVRLLLTIVGEVMLMAEPQAVIVDTDKAPLQTDTLLPNTVGLVIDKLPTQAAITLVLIPEQIVIGFNRLTLPVNVTFPFTVPPEPLKFRMFVVIPEGNETVLPEHPLIVDAKIVAEQASRLLTSLTGELVLDPIVVVVSPFSKTARSVNVVFVPLQELIVHTPSVPLTVMTPPVVQEVSV